MTYQFRLGEQEESDEYSNRTSFPLNLFFWLSHLTTLAEEMRVALESQKKSVEQTLLFWWIVQNIRRDLDWDYKKENRNLW